MSVAFDVGSFNPFDWFQTWYAEAQEEGAHRRDTMALATANPLGQPSLRYVFFRGVYHGGLVFYTNFNSRKGRELAANPRAAMAFLWPTRRRQIRIEGRVERLPHDMAGNYFASRSRASQISAWASHQSARIPNRNAFMREVAACERRFETGPVPMPAWWGGYRLLPDYFEFWQGAAHRRHHRKAFEKNGEGWQSYLLAP